VGFHEYFNPNRRVGFAREEASREMSKHPVNTLVSDPVEKPAAQAGPEPISVGPASFSDVYAAHSQPIYYLCLRMLGDPQKAEDAAHDVFLRAYRHLETFRGESSWRTWLYRIAINHCRNLQQTWHERHMFSNVDDVVWETASAPTESPLRVLETKELGERIQKTLDSLTPEYRLILLLVADEDLSYEQVATLTNQTSDAVRGKLHRARKAFAQIYQQLA
jgi:RNA polymerase sigma-70 factor (ECF subfamily)